MSDAPAHSEIVDAVGWLYNCDSILIECKVSLADYYADRKKPFRRDPAKGIGRERYFFAPKGLVDPKTLPRRWGLIEWDGKNAKRTIKAKPFNRWARRQEMFLLVSAMRRVAFNFEEARNGRP